MDHRTLVARRKPSLLLHPLALALALLGASQAGCDCPRDCEGGFEWRGTASGGLPSGTYAFSVELDGAAFGFDCRVDSTHGECDEATSFDRDDDFELDAYVDTDGASFSTGPSIIVVQARRRGGSGSPGPESVHIVATRDGDTLIDTRYTLDYEGDQATGDACDACEPMETREDALW